MATAWAVAGAITLATLASVPLGTGVGSAPAVSAVDVAVPTTSPAAPVGTGSVVVAPGYSPPSDAQELGAVPARTPVEVEVGLGESNATALASAVSALYAPGSPAYHAFLSPTTLGTEFGAPASEVGAAQAYFASFGLTATVDTERLLLTVTGPAGAVGAAFGTNLTEFETSGGGVEFAHTSPATLPARLGVSGVLGLGDTTPIRPAADGTPELPIAGPDTGCTVALGEYSPCDILGAYNETPLLANGTNGSGVRLAVVDAYSSGEPEGLLANDLAAFASGYGLTFGPTDFVYPVPTSRDLNQSGTNVAWTLEDALDLEWAHVAAPGATVLMTLAPDAGAGLYASVDWLVANDAASIISLSWGEQDTGVFNAYSTPCAVACNATTDGSYGILGPVLEAAAAEGISVFAASGDCGASDGTSAVSTNFPASDPFVTGVGGTDLDVTPNGTYGGELAWSGNATGAHSPGCQNQGGSGGGWSPFPRPWWQTGLPSSPALRGVPDVALDAGYPVGIELDGDLVGVIGTSVATPIWAGIAALADQYHGEDLGFLDPTLYAVAAHDYPTDFHDITRGSNGYSAGTGWDPVTGLGSPNVVRLVPDLGVVAAAPATPPSVVLYGSPRYGTAPLTVRFQMEVTGGTGAYALEGVVFGDGNSSTAVNGSTEHTFTHPGVYAAVGYAVDTGANGSASAPIAIVVGTGHALTVGLTVGNARPAAGEAVEFSLAASGGTSPYDYDLSFGDGTYLDNTTLTSVLHTYPAAGGYCAEAVARDAASDPDGGQSLRVAMAVGGAPVPDCANDTAPLVVTVNPNPGIRDAPADFPDLFNYTGGDAGAGAVATTVQYTSADPYLHACGCTIERNPGLYPVTAWVNDTVGQEASASTNLLVTPPLVGTFAASTLDGPEPLHIYFFSKVKGGYLANANDTVWTLGDGREMVGQSINVTYVVPGQYVAVGHLEDAAHGNVSEAFLVDVEPNTGTAPIGVVGSISPAVDVPSGSVVTFTGNAVGPNMNALNISLDWAFGNGESAFGSPVSQSMFGPLPAADHDTFASYVRVMFYDAQVLQIVNFSLPSFYAVEPGGFLDAVTAVNVTGTLSVTTGLAPVHLIVRGNASGPGGGILSWSFDDGSTASGTYLEHTLYAEGPYNIEPTVTDPFGDRSWISLAVVVNGTLQIFGGPSPSTGAPPLLVHFHVSAQEGSGPPYSFRWFLPNGTESNATAFTVSLSSLGVYKATVSVTDRAGNVVNKTFSVNVVAPGILSPPVILILGAGAGAGVSAAAYRTLAAYARGRRPFNPLRHREERAWRRVW